MNKIFLSSPHMGGTEMKYIQDAFKKNWIAPLGENVNEFEKSICEYVNIENALALSSGTAAIHLALKAVGVEQNDYVFCSTLTFSASCNPIMYEKAIPVFIDSDESWNMSPKALQKAFDWAEIENKMPKAVIVVDLYGQSAKYDDIISICSKYNVPIIEDAAEALGATYQNKYCGTFGDFGIFSFNGNKIITTSGGGMLVCNDKIARDKMFFWATQSRENERYYEHKEVGYNYRLSNVCAGIGRGQMEVLNDRVKKKRDIYTIYKEAFEDLPINMMDELPNAHSTFWLSCMTLEKNSNVTPLEIIKALENENIESRPIWKPMHLQPVFEKYNFFSSLDNKSVSEEIFENGLCLPSDSKMSEEEQERVISIIRNVFREIQ